MDFTELDFNEEFVSAFNALENTSDHLFITGKAGTGKSTLLQYFCQRSKKKMALLAPTGVAAINIKGQTIHSFFGFKPDVTPESVGDIPVRKRKRKMYQGLQAIIIDEISMVRADLLDCVEVFLRLYGPHYDRPFGGVQMLFFGDLFQLPPVVAQAEESIFKTHYPSPYFFSARAFESLHLKILQLEKIYRQKDEHFIRLLNAVRDDNVADHHWQALNRRFRPAPQVTPEGFSIVLTTTNALADKVNSEHLANLPGPPRIYQGIIAGDFERKSLPTSQTLELKKGAQVMMLNNDPEKRWVNGSLGKIIGIISTDEGEDVIKVQLENSETVDVKKNTWDIFQYYFDQEANALASKTIGLFTQYPLKLAWAVTIHKSQGQTFERVVIDVGWGTFSHGQMYVALSRCTSLEGIILKQPLLPRHILMDKRVMEFMKTRLLACLVLLLFSFPMLGLAQGTDADQPYIGLVSETDTTINKDWSFVEDYHARVKIQKDTAKNLGQWPVYYNRSRERIMDIKAWVEEPDGKKWEATAIKDYPAFDALPVYDDMRVKTIALPGVGVGSIIDVRVKTMVSRQEMPHQFWTQVAYPSIATRYARFSFVFPENLPIAFWPYHNTTTPIIEKKDGMVKYTFVFENTVYSPDEDFMPPLQEMVGIISLSSLKDWQQVADWWRDQMNMNTGDDPVITNKVLELIDKKPSDKDRAHAILEFIQDNFRYVPMSMGDHEVSMHPTSVTFNNHYGDAKDLSILARQMFKIAGLDANVCLLSGEFNGDPRHSLPGFSAFDHVMLRLSLGGESFFVDPQAKGFDINQLPASLDNAYVLIIDDEGYHWDNLPIADASFHAVTSLSVIMVHEDGGADYQVHVQMPLEASQDLKSNWDPASDASKSKFFDNLQANFAQGATLTDRHVKGLEERYGPLEFNFRYSAPGAYPVVNDMVLVKESQQDNAPDFDEDKRRYPVFVPTNSVIISRNTYHWDSSLKLDFVPASYHLETDFMQVNIQYARSADAVTVESIYRLKRALLPKVAFAEVKKFHQDLDAKNEQYIVLRKKSSLAPEAKSWLRGLSPA